MATDVTEVKLLPEIGLERMRMALLEIGRDDLASALNVGPCSVCGRPAVRCPGTVPEDGRALAAKAAAIVWYRPGAHFFRGSDRPACHCEGVYERPGQMALALGGEPSGADHG